MTRLFRGMTGKIGLPPGTLQADEDEAKARLRISAINYSSGEFSEDDQVDVDDLFPLTSTEGVSWINIDGPTPQILENLRSKLNIHPLVLEDILHLGQRPKIENHKDYIFMVLKMVYNDEHNGELMVEQISVVFGKGYLITFQERSGDVFENIRNRIRDGHGQIRKCGSDYLAYAILDAIVDNYFYLIEDIDNTIESIDKRLVVDSDTDAIGDIHILKRHLILLRKQLWPVREIATGFMRSDTNSLIDQNTRVYLQDAYEHIIQITEMLDSFREMLSSLHDVYLSISSNKMNEVMKTLTIFAAIFIPLTFIAGIYGMNFEYMPELKWHWGYFGILGLMGAVAVAMLIVFKQRKWF